MYETIFFEPKDKGKIPVPGTFEPCHDLRCLCPGNALAVPDSIIDRVSSTVDKVQTLISTLQGLPPGDIQIFTKGDKDPNKFRKEVSFTPAEIKQKTQEITQAQTLFIFDNTQLTGANEQTEFADALLKVIVFE